MTEQEKTDMIFELLDDFTSGGKLYFHEESIWMINPNVKQWIFEFTKSGKLWYSYPVFTNIFKYISMEHPDFTLYITKWVERILQNEVKNTYSFLWDKIPCVERILQNEVKNTTCRGQAGRSMVERILQNEVKNTRSIITPLGTTVERILQNGIKNTDRPLPDYEPNLDIIKFEN